MPDSHGIVKTDILIISLVHMVDFPKPGHKMLATT